MSFLQCTFTKRDSVIVTYIVPGAQDKEKMSSFYSASKIFELQRT